MEQNYKSASDIVSISNSFISQNKARYKKNMFTNNPKSNGVKITIVDNEDKQLVAVMQHLRQPDALSCTAILYRNNLSSIPLADALSRAGIPFYIKDIFTHFFTNWVVQDILAFIRLGLNPYDISQLERIYYKANAYITKVSLQHVQRMTDAKDDVFNRLLAFPSLTDAQNKRIYEFSHGVKSLVNLQPIDAINYIEDVLEYSTYLQRNSRENGYSLDGLNEVIWSLKEIAKHCKDIESFLRRFEELQEVIDSSKFNKHKNAVTLTTVYSAKGLEFPDLCQLLLYGQGSAEYESAIASCTTPARLQSGSIK